ncbi:tellurium resistance protein TerC [Bowmanella dokdonensis]|uniref:Tellurium resistance protein TerC n=1 Tax=Bowmanella dokdonensis TaxID=751969 RepID=A0A939IN90_9ALTE|nr:tellurium resistance protein TerC [Bowmanella dokdonensis]MBN7824580.1 tellurium resistance protein TerC [Bowmanella dokdonensis]
MKTVRIVLGTLLAIFSVVLSILPGSILFLLAGLMLLSVDFPLARRYLKHCQKIMQTGARRFDRYLLNRKLSR